MTKFQILTLNNISHQALLRFTPDRYAVSKHAEQPDAILVRSHDMHAMNIPRTVKAIGRAGTGRFTLKKATGGRTQFRWKEKLVFPWWMGGPVGAFVSKPVLARVWRRNLQRLAGRFHD